MIFSVCFPFKENYKCYTRQGAIHKAGTQNLRMYFMDGP